jgi:hypothetical protein
MKQIKSILLIAAALVSLTACHNHLDLTPDGWLTELSSNRVFAQADVNGLDNVTKAATTATTASLDAGFNVFASNVKNEPIWNYEFTPDGEGHFTNENAMWVKAGKMTFRAVYPKDLTIENDGTIGPDNYVNNWFLEKDPLVAVTTTSPSEDGAAPVHFNFYHIASQIRANVINNSDWDVRVHADLNSYYRTGTFTWKEPANVTLPDGTRVKKLPANCWAQPSDDTDYVGGMVGNTAGSVNAPLSKGDRGNNLIVANIVPVVAEAKTMTSPAGTTYDREATNVKYTIYWTNDKNGNGKEDAGESESFEVSKEITSLIPGVAYIFTLEINGDYEPTAMISTATVDDFAQVTETIPVSPWAKAEYTIALASSNDEFGTVEGAGTYKEGTQVTIKAVPAAGYVFKRWSDGDTNAERTFTVSENLDLTALFAEKATWSALYVQFSSAWQVTNADKMTQGDDNHTWTKTLNVTDSNVGWDGSIGFVIPTGTSYSAKVYNLDNSNPGHLVLKNSSDTYVYIPVELGEWVLTFNDKTLEYSITSRASVKTDLANLIAWLEDEENDPNEYEYTEETLAVYNEALAAAKAVVEGDDYDAIEAALAALREAYYGLKTKGGSSELPDLPGNL